MRQQTLHPYADNVFSLSKSTAAHRHNDAFNSKRQDLLHWNCTTLLILSFSASMPSMQLLSTSHCPYLAGVIASICQHTIPSVFHLCSSDRERKGQAEWEWTEKMSLCNTCTYCMVYLLSHASHGAQIGKTTSLIYPGKWCTFYRIC